MNFTFQPSEETDIMHYAAGSQKKGAKYISRKKVNGKWVYKYDKKKSDLPIISEKDYPYILNIEAKKTAEIRDLKKELDNPNLNIIKRKGFEKRINKLMDEVEYLREEYKDGLSKRSKSSRNRRDRLKEKYK